MSKNRWPGEKFMKKNYWLYWDRVDTRSAFINGDFKAGEFYDSAESNVEDLNEILSNTNCVNKGLRWNLLSDGYMQEYGKYQYAKGLYIGELITMASFYGGYMTGKLIKRWREKKH